jgi:hypothetical protein
MYMYVIVTFLSSSSLVIELGLFSETLSFVTVVKHGLDCFIFRSLIYTWQYNMVWTHTCSLIDKHGICHLLTVRF